MGSRVHLQSSSLGLVPIWERRNFSNGYATDAPRMRVEFRGVTVRGRGSNKEFVIKLGRILMRPTRKR